MLSRAGRARHLAAQSGVPATHDGMSRASWEAVQANDWGEVQSWLIRESLAQYSDGFLREGFDRLADLADMTDEDIEACGIKKRGHKKRARKACAKLQILEDESTLKVNSAKLDVLMADPLFDGLHEVAAQPPSGWLPSRRSL